MRFDSGVRETAARCRPALTQTDEDDGTAASVIAAVPGS